MLTQDIDSSNQHLIKTTTKNPDFVNKMYLLAVQLIISNMHAWNLWLWFYLLSVWKINGTYRWGLQSFHALLSCIPIPPMFVNLISDLNIYVSKKTLGLKCMSSLLGELQTFSIKIWLDIYAERLRHKVKCQLFQIQLLSINNTFLLAWIAF